MDSSDPHTPAARSGIQTATSGERHIPQSVRADGSIRREIRIRPGYRPPEDVEKYKNRTAEGWKSRASAGVPGAETLEREGDTAAGAKGKNAKRREARRKAKSTDHNGQSDSIGVTAHESGNTAILEPAAQSPAKEKEWSTAENTRMQGSNKDAEAPEPEQLDPGAEKEKQARNLKKRLRQARDLQSKKESGDVLLPEQFAKVIKIQELVRQLGVLGFDSDGARKPQDVR